MEFNISFNLIFKKRLHALNIASLDTVMENRPSFSFETSIDWSPIVQQQLHLHQEKFAFAFLLSVPCSSFSLSQFVV